MAGVIKKIIGARRENFVTYVGCPDRATRELFGFGIQELFLTNPSRLTPI
jgi:hypothetical protein